MNKNKLSLITMLLMTVFSFCHFSVGSFAVVMYHLFFIVVNAVFYGIVYKRSNNIIVSILSSENSGFFTPISLK